MYCERKAPASLGENSTRHDSLPDTQAEKDARNLAITSAGVAGVRLPFEVIDVDEMSWTTVVTAAAGVDVPAEERGTHMSRFVEFLNEHASAPLQLQRLPRWAQQLRARLNGQSARLDMEFSSFVAKYAPVSKRKSLVEVPVKYQLRTNSEPGLWQSASVLATTVCPCSKAISERGAHNQRCTIHLELEVFDWVPVAELVSVVDGCASCAVYGVLKREDEKAVTESGFDNAKFVEDVARDVYLTLTQDKRIVSLVVEARSHESIHGHDAVARIESDSVL